MTDKTEIYVLQTRWMGGDEWYNATYVGRTETEAEQLYIHEWNEMEIEEAQDEGREPRVATTLLDVHVYADGEFFYIFDKHEIGA